MDIKRESIFISATRRLCNTLAGMIGIVIGFVIIMIVIGLLSKPNRVSDKTTLIIASDAEGNRELLPHSAPVILKLNIHGAIGTKDLNTQTVESQLLDSRTGTLENDRIKGILLHVNSPGGTAFDSHAIYNLLVDYKKKYDVPIYAYIDGICASGGVMVACAADKILSAPVGIIGSVGVMMGPNFNFAGLMEKHGIKQLTITKGKNKDMLSPFREWKAEEDQSIKDIIDYDYNMFVDLVANARPQMNKDRLINEYGAQVYDPIRAQNYGYIDDGNSSYRHALSELTEKANIDGKYQVVELKVVHPVFSDLIEGKSPLFTGKIKHEIQLPTDLPPELLNRPLYLYPPLLQ